MKGGEFLGWVKLLASQEGLCSIKLVVYIIRYFITKLLANGLIRCETIFTNWHSWILNALTVCLWETCRKLICACRPWSLFLSCLFSLTLILTSLSNFSGTPEQNKVGAVPTEVREMDTKILFPFLSVVLPYIFLYFWQRGLCPLTLSLFHQCRNFRSPKPRTILHIFTIPLSQVTHYALGRRPGKCRSVVLSER